MFKLLFHPHITLAATIGAVSAMAGACGAFIGAMQPLSSIARFVPFIHAADGYLTTAGLVLGVVAGCLTIVAGLGRSFSPLIDGTQPLYH